MSKWLIANQNPVDSHNTRHSYHSALKVKIILSASISLRRTQVHSVASVCSRRISRDPLEKNLINLNIKDFFRRIY
jgi:hypothetical protein